MEWLISTTEFKRRDRSYFAFNPSQPFKVLAIKIEGTQNGKVDFKHKEITSVSEYGAWIKSCRPSSARPHRPTLLLAIHRRLEGQETFDRHAETSLAYTEENFSGFCKDLCQHRTLASILGRKSTAVFSCRPVTWHGTDGFGPSTVYHCKSDTDSLKRDDDIVLSSTCFTDAPVTFAVMYGCTERVMDDTRRWLERCEGFAFHPLVLPMVFAEHERKHLFNAIDEKSTKLEERILELEKRVKKDPEEEEEQQGGKRQGRQPMTQRDCEAIDLWRSMSSLKNGLESLYTELGSMREHLHALPKFPQKHDTDSGGHVQPGQGPEVYIDARLKEMMAEFRSKIRKCEGLLGSMTLATQMEWNYYTRRDAQVNFSIATATRMDSSQMKQISLLGMIFLPGTFLATFFSMTFFSWIPDGSAQKISPWLALYAGLTLLLTSGTILWFKHWSTIKLDDARKSVEEDLDKISLFTRKSWRTSSSSAEAKDPEMGSV